METILLDRTQTETKHDYTLTTNHPASCYGQPVLLDSAGSAYGSDDVVIAVDRDIFGDSTNITAAMIVSRWCKSQMPTDYKAIDAKILQFAGL